MDNQNDLQWRPEDWQHTLGHLRRAEKLLLLKTWGVGAAVIGTAASGIAVYLNGDGPAQDAVVAEVNVADPSANLVAASATSSAADGNALATEVSTASEGLITWEAALNPEGSEAQLAAPGPERLEWEERGERDLASSSETEGQRAVKPKSSPAQVLAAEQVTPIVARRGADVLDASTSVRESLQAPAAMEAAEVSRESAIAVLALRHAELFSNLPIPEALHATAQSSPLSDSRERTLPSLRISALFGDEALALEIPKTIANTGPVRWEVAPGLSWSTQDKVWSAVHPAETFGGPAALKRVASSGALQTHVAFAAMHALNYQWAIGLSGAIQYEWARRMDVGTWNADAGDWFTLESEALWGRVEEANPLQLRLGGRIDWSVAPEWKIVAQGGWATLQDKGLDAMGIEVEGQSPLWIQIGIQR